MIPPMTPPLNMYRKKGMLKMIYTVTFNPALDYVMKLDSFKPGHMNRTVSECFIAGGKGLNVSNVLSRLGVDNTALGFTAGFTGAEIERLVTESGCKSEFIRLKEGCSRVNVKLNDTVRETEINAGGPVIDDEARERLTARLESLREGDTLVMAGSIPKSLPSDIYSNIMAQLAGRGVNIVVDAEKDLLLKCLEHKPFLVKPNHVELGDLFCDDLSCVFDRDELIAKVTEYGGMLRNMGAKNVLVSMAGDGALLMDSTGKTHIIEAPEGMVKNSVGAGDSMVAGFLAGYSESSGDYGYALRMGVAAGSASAFSETFPEAKYIRQLFEHL